MALLKQPLSWFLMALLAYFVFARPLVAQDPRNAAEFAEYCQRQGLVASFNPPSCNALPGGDAGGERARQQAAQAQEAARYAEINRVWKQAQGLASASERRLALLNTLELARRQQAIRYGASLQEFIGRVETLLLWTDGVISDENGNYWQATQQLHSASKSRPAWFTSEHERYRSGVFNKWLRAMPRGIVHIYSPEELEAMITCADPNGNIRNCIRTLVIETRILDPDDQAGMKSQQTVTVDMKKCSISSDFITGKTEKYGIVRESVRDSFTSVLKSCSTTGALLEIEGETASGVVLLPNINYKFEVDLRGNSPALTGCHNTYPAYFVTVDDQLIYDFVHRPRPEGFWSFMSVIYDLMGDCDVAASR